MGNPPTGRLAFRRELSPYNAYLHLFFKTPKILTHFKIWHQLQFNVTEIKPQGQLQHVIAVASNITIFLVIEQLLISLCFREAPSCFLRRLTLVSKKIVYDGDKNVHNSNFWKKNMLLLVMLSISICFPAWDALCSVADFPQFLRF